jgi:outer membrane receptor protein involved in Fe transport
VQKQIRSIYLVVSALTVALPAFDAFAQASSSTTSADDDTGGLADIVVTAQRRSESLQDLPISVTAVTNVQLENVGITGIGDLPLAVPALNIQKRIGYLTEHLRGVGSIAVGAGLENPIAFHVDGVYHANQTAGILSFDGSPVAFEAVHIAQRDWQLSDNFQVTSHPKTIYFGQTPALNPSFPVGNVFDDARQDSLSVAGYGQATYAVNNVLDVTAGFRYSHERRNLDGYENARLLVHGDPLIQIVPPIALLSKPASQRI